MIDDRILKHIPGMDSGATVQRVNANELTEKSFARDFVDTNTPVLIKGGLKHWPAYKKWIEPGYLESISDEAKINYHRHLNFSNDSRMKKTAKPHSFLDALKEMRSGIKEVLFMPISFKKKHFKALKDDVTGFPFLTKRPKPLFYPEMRLFIYKGAGSSWHLHVLDETIMCQISGKKRVAMLPTNDSTYPELKEIFYHDKLMDGGDCIKHMDGRIKPLVVDVDAGDTLYIPPNWWHGVEPLDDEMGMTIPYCWRSPYHKISNLRYPAVRELYKDAFKKPGIPMLVIPLYGLVTLMAQCIRRCKLLVAG